MSSLALSGAKVSRRSANAKLSSASSPQVATPKLSHNLTSSTRKTSNKTNKSSSSNEFSAASSSCDTSDNKRLINSLGANLSPTNANDTEVAPEAATKTAPSTQTPSTTNTKAQQANSSPIIAKKKTDPRDRLSSMFDGSNQGDDKPIFRVNLLKKSNRQSLNPLSSGKRFGNLGGASFKKSSQSVQLVEEAIKVAPASLSQDNDNQPSCSHKVSSSDGRVIKQQTTKSNKGSSKQSESATSERGNNSTQLKSTKNAQTSQYEEAKKSRKLVVSLIKDISKTVSKEDLDEMLKEIHTVIGEIGQQPSHSKNNKEIEVSNPNLEKSKHDRISSSKKKPATKQLNKVITSNSSDVSSSDPKEVNYFDDESNLLDKEFSNYNKDRNLMDDLKPSVNETLDRMLNSESVSDISRQNFRKQLMELSSDEENNSNNKNRQPNSSRLPDRCLRITSSHAKYISPHRKRSLEERMNRAQEAREKLLEYRANRFREIFKKVEEMRAWKEEDTMNLKASVQTKLQKAAAKRKEQLDKIIRKAHDEDSKVSEIQFINNLEAQNRRHDMNSRKKEFEARLQDLQDERQRKIKEKKQAKEMAAEERRKTLEAERKTKLLEIQQRRKLKNLQVEQQQQVREKKRIEKNLDRQQKIEAIKEAYNAGVQTLKKRINQKQEQSERRHEVNLRLIRQKAFELSIKRYNSFISETNASTLESISNNSNHRQKEKESAGETTRRLQLKPFNTKKFCNLCKETISSELALFSHLRSEIHHTSINEHYGNTMLTTNEAVEIHNLRHIVDTNEPIDPDTGGNSDDQQSSRASSLVNYYHSSHLSQANEICMSEKDRESLLAIERKCRKLRHKLIVAGKPFNRDWFTNKIRSRLAQLLIQQRVARNQTTNTDATSVANTIDLSANNVNCQCNKPFYLKITRILRELISVATEQRISGGGLMPAGIIHSVDRLLADLNKQLNSRKIPQLSSQLLYLNTNKQGDLDADHLAMATKMIESYAIDTLFLYDIVTSLVTILRKIVPNVSLTSKLPTTVASHYSTLIDPISLNSYYCHKSPVLPARIYIKMLGFIQNLCCQHSDLCYILFQSNNMINLSDILSYRLGFIIGNESPASSISGSSSAATLSAHTIDSNRKKPSLASKQQQQLSPQKVGTKLQQSNTHNKSQASTNEQSGADKERDEQEDEENDGDFWERAETYKRTDEIVDDMTASLCKLLATITETILSRPLILLNQLDKVAFDQRSDDFIR